MQTHDLILPTQVCIIPLRTATGIQVFQVDEGTHLQIRKSTIVYSSPWPVLTMAMEKYINIVYQTPRLVDMCYSQSG